MSTFCRITGKSKGLPRPNYFPLLPPISPADAKRFCRITGKAYGLPTHHYIPVLVGLPPRKQTPFAPAQLPHEANGITCNKTHVMLADYRYVFPCYEESNDLIQLLATKKTESRAHYVYKVAERRCSLVFTAQMEAAVRDGDIRNVMLAKDSDTLLVKLKRGIDVSVDVKEMSIEGLELYDGEGPSEEVLSKRPKRKKAGGTDLVRKIFEDKEKEAEKEFAESESKRPKMMKLSGENTITKGKAVTKLMDKFQNVQNFKAEDSKVVTDECSADLMSSLENVDWNKFKADSAEPSGRPVSSKMPTPLEIQPENVDLGSSLPGIIHQPNYPSEGTIGLQTTAAVTPLNPLVAKPDANVQEAINNMSAEDLAKTADVNSVFGEDGQKLDLLPRPEEISEIVKNMKVGVPSVVDRDGKNVHGLKVDIESAQRLVVGVSLETASGSVFMPGQTLNTPAGDVFVPGVTVCTPNGPRLIPGQVVDVEDTSGQKTPMFVAGQTLVTRDGEMFVQGQCIETPEGAKFMPGQTVLSENIPKFVPGQVIFDEEGQHRFVSGKTVSTPDGQHFIPGQMHQSVTGESLFVPGQSVQTEQGWEFVPGKNMVFEDGDIKFIPGQEIETAKGQCFVPGQFVNSNGNTMFVPGMAVENEQGLKFVPGAKVNSPNGQRFVEGQVYKSDNGTLSFVPGVTTIEGDGSYKFAAATSLKDVVFRNDMSVGISIESVHVNGEVSDDVIYGHMVQTSQGVEFFPGVASGLPAGKVVPGRLVRGKEVKFVPGLLIDGKFVPGQVVSTDHGEQFIPGQVVETKDGPKFVPGQIIETNAGPKFVPGQTIQTEEGPKFVPGQIVETKAGPTFIPGQIISTDEEGCRFVPGQVVDTAEGPRFVPGRVVETGDRVTFIPGQVVQTSEGLKFVAPDLQDDAEGGVEFTVQGFSITPEELSLLKNRKNSKTTISAASGEAAIDSRMMRQLSEAGMSIGRQVPADVPLVDVRTVPAMGIACSLADKLGLDAISTIKLSQILAAVADLNYEIPIVGQSLENVEEIQLLQSMLRAASKADSEFSLYNELCRFLEKVLASKPDVMVEVIDKFHKFVINSEMLTPLRRESKLITLRDVVQNGTDENAVTKLTSVLSDDQAGLSSAFKHLTEGRPELVDSVVKKVSQTVNELRNEKAASDSLQRAIVNTVRESSEISVQQMLRDVEGFGLQTLLSEAVGLARALGLRDIALTLTAIMNDPNSTRLLEGDRVTLDILRRLTVMRQLAEKRPDFALALRKLQSDPELARSDPFIRELVRESGSLLILPDDAPLLQNSSDIPTSLLQNDNSLAMEDFMLRSQKHGILLIIKHGLQAVVPREAARAVLTGQVPYTVLDETGIHHFAPLHVFSALHLPPVSTHRFSMYSIHTEEDAGTLTPATSTDDFRKLNNPSVCTNPEQCLSEESGELIFTANQDFIADDMDALTLHRGEQVILLDTGCDPSK